MAQQIARRNLAPILEAGSAWIQTCLIDDGSIFTSENLWTRNWVEEVRHAFVDHPDFSHNDFMTKLRGQMKSARPEAKQLMAEMLWALLLFPSNMKARTKSLQIREIWGLSGKRLPEKLDQISEPVLQGIGSGGPGFNNYRPIELEYLIELTTSIKDRAVVDRRKIFESYDAFIDWIDSVRRGGSRQFRHMLRYFAFPDRVERMSSNNDRRRIIDAFGMAPFKATKSWSDKQMDLALLTLRKDLEKTAAVKILDFYEPPLKERWAIEKKIATPTGEATIFIPEDEEEIEEAAEPKTASEDLDVVRESIKIQATLAAIGAAMGCKIWIPANDRARVSALISGDARGQLLETLPLNYELDVMRTVSQIDVIWIRKQAIIRAFEVEHTTAVYSGLLRMADLLALQPNLKIDLHIVAPDERREKVFREMQRPVFSYLDAGALSNTCSFLSYESVILMSQLGSLSHMNPTLVAEYEERVKDSE